MNGGWQYKGSLASSYSVYHLPVLSGLRHQVQGAPRKYIIYFGFLKKRMRGEPVAGRLLLLPVRICL